MKIHRSRPYGYAVAVAIASAAVLLALLLRRSEGELAYPLSFAAVMASAWYGGLGPGLAAAILVGIASTALLFTHAGSLKANGPRELFHLGLFALAALLISRAQAMLQAARQQIEEQARKSGLS
jgi:K+-sensing histidine kinase KdpD